MEPKLSVIVPVFNGAPSIISLIDRILSCGLSDLEILVGNDASTDETQSMLDSIQDSRVRVFSFTENLGAGAVRNALLAAAKGEYIAMQDADDSFRADRFLKQILFLEAHPEIGVVGSAASLVEGSSSWGSLLPSKKPSFKDWIFKRSVVHASILFRKSLLNEKTQYHENLDFGEDYHFLLQIYFQGARFENLEEELYIYKISKADLKQRAFKNFRKLLRMEGELSRLFPLWSRPFYLGLNSLKLVLSFAKGFVSFMKERQ